MVSGDLQRAEDVALKMDSGMVFLNSGMVVNPAIPFGGIKASGFGRECSDEGFRSFTNQKTIVI